MSGIERSKKPRLEDHPPTFKSACIFHSGIHYMAIYQHQYLQFPLHSSLTNARGVKKRRHIQVGSLRLVESGWRSTGKTERSREVSSRTFLHFFTLLSVLLVSEGIMAVKDAKNDAPRGLGDFQRRLNRDQGRNWNGDHVRSGDMTWDSTPRSEDGLRGPWSSARVPNIGWEFTPLNSRGADHTGWGSTKNRLWDAPTPRSARDTSPDNLEGVFGYDLREWEEEQVRLDRDWYTGAEDGVLAGDEEHNPLAQYEDLNILKQAEVAAKQTVR